MMDSLQMDAGFSLAKERLLIIKLETVLLGEKNVKSGNTRNIFDIRLLLQLLLGLFLSLF